MSAPGSHLARQMRPHLGTELWDEFVEHANRHYKAGWLRAFAPESGVLRCVGTLDGAPCTHAVLVDLRAGAGMGVGREREVGKALEQLHLDHERPLAQRCATTYLGCARARRTTPRVCAVSMRPASQCRGCGAAVCGPCVLSLVAAGVRLNAGCLGLGP